MAGNRRNVFLDFLINDQQARAGLQGVANEAGKTQSRFSQLSGGAKALVGGFAALAATRVIAFFSEATQAAMADLAAQKQLALALRNTVGATDEQIASTEEFIDKTARATGVVDDQLRPALANLVRATGDVDEAQALLGVSMDIAAARGLDLEKVTVAMMKAHNGNIGALGRLGVATKNAAGETLTFDEAITEASRTMGGATAVAAKTAEGEMRRLNVTISEAKETIGRALIPVVAQGAEALNDMDKVLGFVGDKLGELPGPAGGFAKEITGWLGPLGALNKIWGLAAEQAEKFIAAEEAAAAAVDTGAAAMDRARHPASRLTDQQEELAEATESVAAAIREMVDEQMAAASPAFAALKSARDLDEAQEGYNRTLTEYGVASDEAQDAAVKLAEAQVAAEAAALMFARQGGAASIEALKSLLREGGALPATIDAIVQSILGFNQTPIRKLPSWFGTVVRSDALVGARASGGPVPAGGTFVVGEDGPEVLQMGSSSGSIIPNNQLGGGGGLTVHVHGSVVTERQLVELVRKGLVKNQRRNGTSGIV